MITILWWIMEIWQFLFADIHVYSQAWDHLGPSGVLQWPTQTKSAVYHSHTPNTESSCPLHSINFTLLNIMWSPCLGLVHLGRVLFPMLERFSVCFLHQVNTIPSAPRGYLYPTTINFFDAARHQSRQMRWQGWQRWWYRWGVKI